MHESTRARAAAAAGVAFVVFLAGAVIPTFNSPDATALPAKVIAYYTNHNTATYVSAYLTVFAVVTGVYFFGALRQYIRDLHGNAALATIGFGGALIFAVGGALSAGFEVALVDKTSRLTPGAAQALNAMQSDGTIGLTAAGLAIFYIATGIAIARSGALPRWIGWFAVVLGVLSLTPVFWLAFMATLIWVLAAAIALFMRAGSLSEQTPETA